MTDRVPIVPAGLVGVEVACPQCGVLERIAVQLVGVLTMPADDGSTLRVKAKSRPMDHECRAIEVDLFTATEPDEATNDVD
jgi:hypothetical protein